MGELIELSQEILVAGEKTDQELIDEGKVIARDTEKAGVTVMRKTGEWYAEVQATRKKAPRGNSKHTGVLYFSPKDICAQAGVAYSTAAQSSQFIRAFPTDGHLQGLTIDKCIALLPAHTQYLKDEKDNKKLANKNFHDEFISMVVSDSPEPLFDDPDPKYIYDGPMSMDAIKRQVSLLTKGELPPKSEKLGIATSTAVDNITPVIESLNISGAKQKKIRDAVTKEINRIQKEIHGHFIDEVNKAADEIAEQRTEELRQSAQTMLDANRAAQKRADDKFNRAETREKRLPKFMDKKEFKLIQGCLHSDRIPDDMRKRFDRAFEIFNRLAEGGDW